MITLGLLLASAAVFITAYFLLKGALLDLSRPMANPWPILWHFENLLVLLPVVLVSCIGVENVEILYAVSPEIEGMVAFYAFSSLLLYIVTLVFFLRVFRLRDLREDPRISKATLPFLEQLSMSLSLLGLLLVASFYLLGYKHALLTSLLSGENLLSVRLANAYQSKVPSQLASLLPLVGYSLAFFGGLVKRQKRKGVGYLILAIFFLSARGDKAPVVWGMVIWLLAQRAFLPRRWLNFSVLRLLFLSLLGIVLIYLVASFQIPELTLSKFSIYLVNRLGIGQMAGVYETFGLASKDALPEGEFYWHMVPFARFFVDYVDYQKALMMVTEGYDLTEMGVKNTFFIAEAYAIGGAVLATLSPIIVGFSSALGLFILVGIFRIIFKKFGRGQNIEPFLRQWALIIWIKTHFITGGFSNFPLLKGLTLTLVHIFVIWVFHLTFSMLVRSLPRAPAKERTL